jgi:hypothetical protein
MPYRHFWLVSTLGAVAGIVLASLLGVALWIGFVIGYVPALGLEARWRRTRPPSEDAPWSWVVTCAGLFTPTK